MGFLVISFKKKVEWLKFKLPNGEEIKLLIKPHKSGNRNYREAVIECPKNIKITREAIEANGNN